MWEVQGGARVAPMKRLRQEKKMAEATEGRAEACSTAELHRRLQQVQQPRVR